MASIRFLGRTYTYGNPDPKLDSNDGAVLEQMTDAALPSAIEQHKRLQQLKAAQAKQLRDEARAVAQQFNIEVEG
jgi:hypothetical protein